MELVLSGVYGWIALAFVAVIDTESGDDWVGDVVGSKVAEAGQGGEADVITAVIAVQKLVGEQAAIWVDDGVVEAGYVLGGQIDCNFYILVGGENVCRQ